MTNPIPRLLVLARFAAAAAAGAGLFSLVTWGLGQWRLATYGINYVPMAPVTALLFVLLGLAFGARLQWPGAPAARLACALAAMLTVTVGGLTLVQTGRGFPLPWDIWFVSAATAVERIPVGRMSPLTALTFILTAAALGGQSLRLATRTSVWQGIYVLASAALVLSSLVTAGYATGSPLLYGGTTVPMALLTALAFMSLNAGVLLVGQVDRLLRIWREAVDAQHISAENGEFTRRLILSVAAISGLILLAGLVYLRREQADARVAIYRQLEAIAQLKVEEISTWRNERLGEARFLQQNRQIGRELAAFALTPSDTGKRELQDWLTPIKGGNRYESILVFDPRNRPLLAIPDTAENIRVPQALFAQALAGAEPVFGDIERDARTDTVHLDLLVPIQSPLPTQPVAPVGVIRLRLDPAQFLFPRIQSWPMPSESAEFLLVRREGDEVVYLNELRHRPGTALTLRHSIHEPRLPGAMAARGETGVHEGIDYRGAAVLSASHLVPGSPWFLVAKIDLAEAYSPIQRNAWQTGGAVVLLLLAVILTGLALWRQRHATLLRHTLTVEREHKAMAERLGLVMQHANDCIFLLDETGRILEANDRASATYGYTLDEFRALPSGGLRAPAAQTETARQLDQFRSPGGTVFETVHQRQDGTAFPVEVSGRSVLLDGRQHLLGIYRDISERQTSQREIERLNRMYYVISQVNQTIVRARSATELFPAICRVLAEYGKFPIVWIGWPSADMRMLDPIAVAGDPHGYVPGLRVSIDGAAPEGVGPAGTAFRTGKIQVHNAFMTAPDTQPWHERAALSGIQSSIGLPLRQEGVVRGVLMVYATERGFFGPREIGLLEEAAGDVSFALDVFAGEGRRQEAEAALRAHAQEFKALAEAMPQIVWVTRADGWNIYFNQQWMDYTGLTLAESSGHGWNIPFHPDDRQRAWDAWQNATRNGGTYDLECRLRRADGVYRWWLIRGVPHCNANGEVLKWFGTCTDIEEFKQAARAMAESEAQHRALFEASPVAISVVEVICDTDGRPNDFRYLRVNQAFEQFARVKAADIVGRTVLESFPKSNPEVVERIGRVALTGVTDRFERFTPQVDTYYEATAFSPRPGQAVTLFVDISARKQAEAELKKLSRVVEQSPTSIVITDLTGAIEYVNPWFCTLTGYTFDEMRGQNPRMLKSGDTPAATYTDMWQTLAAGRTWRGELINKKKNGEPYTELAVLAPVFGADGCVTHYVAIKDDITERKRMEQAAHETLQRFNLELEAEVAQRTRALAESEERRELVLQANAMGTFEINLATGEGHWNEAQFALLGLKPAEAPSTAATFFRHVHPDDLGPLMVRWEQALHTGEYDTEFRVVRADGQERWLAARGRLMSGDTRTGRFFGINYDITARKRLEVETTALLERERQVSEMKTRFISMTSHEFRTPMTAIMGSVELLANHLDRLTPEKRHQIFGRINTSLSRMTTMLDDVLTLNRVDAKRTEVRLAAINLGPFLQNLVQEIRAADRDGHPFEVHLPPADVPFVTDPNLLHHIVSNLLSNAVRYSPAGAPVTIHMERDAWRLHLSVENRGIGIPAADRARIFEPFERGSNVDHIKGTGLGLNIVKRLTELLGGHVTLRSPEGGATRFTVALPFLSLPATPTHHESFAQNQDPHR